MNYLENAYDKDTLIKSVMIVNKIIRESSLANNIKEFMDIKDPNPSYSEISTFVQKTVET